MRNTTTREFQWPTSGRERSISIIFPAHNEEDNISRAVTQAVEVVKPLFEDWEVIVVDDGSQDRTVKIVDEMAKRDSRIVAVHHERNRGYGAALKSGIERASKSLVFFTDSDLQFDMNELPQLLKEIQDCHIVAGYRAKRSDPAHRKLNALAWRTLVRILLGLKVRDIDCAFKLFRREIFDSIKIDAVGAMVNTDILVQAVKLGYKIKEVPVSHFPRLHGNQSGAKLRVILKAFKELYLLHYKLRSVAPLSQHGRIQHADREPSSPATAPKPNVDRPLA